jgi:hypothetical protein
MVTAEREEGMISNSTTMRGLVAGAALAGLLATAPANAAPNPGKGAFSGGMDVTTAYIVSRHQQERRGFIRHP